jgi:hypothetical protein
MGLRTRFPERGLVFCELGMIHECQFGAQAAVIFNDGKQGLCRLDVGHK